MNKEAENAVFENICESVRFKMSFGEDLTDQEKMHFEECEECRAYLKQIKIIEKELAEEGTHTFAKNGVTVSDSVMQEIERQSLFTGGRQLKNKGAFRHMGLAAACIILAVMAMPVLNSMFLQEKNFAEEDSADFEYYADETASDDGAVLYSTQNASVTEESEPETFSVYFGDVSDQKQSAEGESNDSNPGVINGAVSATDEVSEEARENKTKAIRLTGGTSGGGGASGAVYDSANVAEYSGEIVVEEAEAETPEADVNSYIIDEAISLAKRYYGEDLKLYSSEIHYSENGVATVKLMFDNGKVYVAEFRLENGRYKFYEN